MNKRVKYCGIFLILSPASSIIALIIIHVRACVCVCVYVRDLQSQNPCHLKSFPVFLKKMIRNADVILDRVLLSSKAAL